MYFPGFIKINKLKDGYEFKNNISNKKLFITNEEINIVDIKEQLVKNDMLFSDETLKSYLNNIENILKKAINVIIMPTTNCNFNCIYCYEKHENKNMSIEQIDSIISYMKGKDYNNSSIKVQWFGGEPLLKMDLIEYFYKKVKDEGINIKKSAMTTNGFLLDINTFYKLYDFGIRDFEITIDGFDHDKKRYTKNGLPTFNRIMNNLIEISKLPKEYNFKIILRRNISADDEDMNFYKNVMTMLSNDSRFIFLVRAIRDFGKKQSLNLIKKEEIDKTLEKHYEYMKSNNIDDLFFYSDRLCFNCCFRNLPNTIVAHPNGNIYNCTVYFDENKVGNISNDKIIMDENNSMNLYNRMKLKCIHCSQVYKCFGLQCYKKYQLNDKNQIVECEDFIYDGHDKVDFKV